MRPFDDVQIVVRAICGRVCKRIRAEATLPRERERSAYRHPDVFRGVTIGIDANVSRAEGRCTRLQSPDAIAGQSKRVHYLGVDEIGAAERQRMSLVIRPRSTRR